VVEFEEDGRKFPILVKELKVGTGNRGKFVKGYKLLPVSGSDFTIEYDSTPQREGWYEIKER